MDSGGPGGELCHVWILFLRLFLLGGGGTRWRLSGRNLK
jgi:hypothetical protein